MSAKRVLYVTAAGASAKSFLRGHFEVLRKQEYEVALACSEDAEAISVTKESNIQLLPIRLSTKISPWYDLVALIQLVRHILTFKPHVVHAHMSKAGFVATLAAIITCRRHRLYHNHGMAYFSSRGRSKVLLGIIEWITCKAATEVIFCSQSTLDTACNKKICARSKAILLGSGTISGVDTYRFCSGIGISLNKQLRLDLNIPANKLVVGFVGRIVAHKGVDSLLRAWNDLPNAVHKQSVLLICGKHDNDALYERLRLASERHANIVYVGRRSNIDEIYRIFDIIVLPSLHEGFPYSVLEAQSSGVPAIVTRVTGNVDSVVHKKTGLVVSPENDQELTDAITNLLNSESTRSFYGRNARDRIVKEFSQELVLTNLVLKYQNLFDN